MDRGIQWFNGFNQHQRELVPHSLGVGDIVRKRNGEGESGLSHHDDLGIFDLERPTAGDVDSERPKRLAGYMVQHFFGGHHRTKFRCVKVASGVAVTEPMQPIILALSFRCEGDHAWEDGSSQCNGGGCRERLTARQSCGPVTCGVKHFSVDLLGRVDKTWGNWLKDGPHSRTKLAKEGLSCDVTRSPMTTGIGSRIEWHSEIHKLIVQLGIDKCRSPWDKDWWLHDPIPVRQGGRPCPRLHDGGFPKRSNRSTNRMFSRFTRSSTPRWSAPRWPRRASRSRNESTLRLSPSACSSPRYWILITRAVRRSRG